jgi:hypothetical protein
MDWVNILFGGVGVISFIFSIYGYYKTESKKAIEAAKSAMHKEMIRNARQSLRGILYSIDSIIQIPKKSEVTIDQMQNLARIARSEAYLLAQQLEIEQKKLDGWQFGKLIESIPEESELK